jgi:GNAT superfamily N-acetyltransferase
VSLVRKATGEDFARLCRTAMLAFADDPVMRWFWPDDEDYYAGDGAVMHSAFRRWMLHDETYTTDDCVAVAAFVPVGRPVVEVPPDPNAPPLSEDLLARFAAIGVVLAEHTPPEPHWYLNLLATHPHWQRQGLGALLMTPITELCDRHGLPMYLETETLGNVAYYSHLGFTVRSEWDVPLDGPHMWGMIRHPR